MRDRLVELMQKRSCFYVKCINRCGKCDGIPINDDDIGRLADYLLENGVIVLPYSIGSKVYSVINSMTLPIPIGVYECEIQRYVLTQHGISAIVKFKKGSVTYGDIHKDVSELHLTPEEAERALGGE